MRERQSNLFLTVLWRHLLVGLYVPLQRKSVAIYASRGLSWHKKRVAYAYAVEIDIKSDSCRGMVPNRKTGLVTRGRGFGLARH